MNRRLGIMAVALLLGLFCLAGAARADESGCTAHVTLLQGEPMTVRNFGVRLLKDDSFLGTEMVVQFDDGQSIIDLRDLKSMTRLAPPEKVGDGQWVTFAFVGRDGKKGTFKVDGGYYMCGQFALGNWTVTGGEVKKVVLTCGSP